MKAEYIVFLSLLIFFMLHVLLELCNQLKYVFTDGFFCLFLEEDDAYFPFLKNAASRAWTAFVNAFQVVSVLSHMALMERWAWGPDWGTWQQPTPDNPSHPQAPAPSSLAGWY